MIKVLDPNVHQNAAAFDSELSDDGKPTNLVIKHLVPKMKRIEPDIKSGQRLVLPRKSTDEIEAKLDPIDQLRLLAQQKQAQISQNQMQVQVVNTIEDDDAHGDIWKSKDESFYQFTSRMNSITSVKEPYLRKLKSIKTTAADLYGWRPDDEVVKEKLIENELFPKQSKSKVVSVRS